MQMKTDRRLCTREDCVPNIVRALESTNCGIVDVLYIDLQEPGA